MKIKDIEHQIIECLEVHRPDEILVAFDIDMTLTQPNHPALFYPNLRKYSEDYKSIMGKLPPEQRDLAVTLTTQNFPQRWVEDETLSLIHTLQNEGIKIIAFTSSLTGNFPGLEDKIIKLRAQQLDAMGLEISDHLPEFPTEEIFTQFHEYAGDFPLFYQGILSTNGEGNISKGECFIAFLKISSLKNFHPKAIFMIDDKRKHLELMKLALSEYDPSIEFKGIEYSGAYGYAPQDISRDDFRKVWDDLAQQAKSKLP